MSRGKYLSLEEVRKGETKGATIKRFAKEHPSEGDERQFDAILGAMALGKDSDGIRCSNSDPI